MGQWSVWSINKQNKRVNLYDTYKVNGTDVKSRAEAGNRTCDVPHDTEPVVTQ